METLSATFLRELAQTDHLTEPPPVAGSDPTLEADLAAAWPAKIGSYAGKAPLDRWLGVAAQRAALMWLRENQTEARARDGAAAEPAANGNTHPEMAFVKDRYRGDFEQALKDSLARLPE